MLFDITLLNNSVTMKDVTLSITLDAETCFTLSRVFGELEKTLSYGARRVNEQRRFTELAPMREREREELHISIAARFKSLQLPRRKAVSVIAKEFQLCWDTADIITAEIAQEGRRKAALERNMSIMKMREEGFTSRAIADRFGLSEGRIRNILTHIERHASAHTQTSEATAS